MFIREALINDLDGIVGCCRRFFEYAEYEKQGLILDEDSYRKMITGYIENKNGIMLLLMDGLYVAGGIAGTVFEWGFNNSIKMCLEHFYWVDKKYRGRKSVELLMEYEKKAKEMGAVKSILISINTDLQDKVINLYQKKGYTELERNFIKTL